LSNPQYCTVLCKAVNWFAQEVNINLSGPWLQLSDFHTETADWSGWSIGAIDWYAFRRNWLICLSYNRCWLICTQKWLIDLFHNRSAWLICAQKELIIPGSTT
jgi:hypothetical protein